MTRPVTYRAVALAARTLVFALLLGTIVIGCTDVKAQRETDVIDKDMYEVTKPVYIGMKRARVMQLVKGSASVGIMVTPGQITMGKKLYLENGVQLRVVFDENDTVSYIFVNDEHRRYRGLGVGSTLQEVREICKDASVLHDVGLGCHVRVAPEVWFRLGAHVWPPPPDSRVTCIEMRREWR